MGDGDGLEVAFAGEGVCVWLNARVTNMLPMQKTRTAKISMVYSGKRGATQVSGGFYYELPYIFSPF
jgi:hypothetical protein